MKMDGWQQTNGVSRAPRDGVRGVFVNRFTCSVKSTTVLHPWKRPTKIVILILILTVILIILQNKDKGTNVMDMIEQQQVDQAVDKSDADSSQGQGSGEEDALGSSSHSIRQVQEDVLFLSPTSHDSLFDFLLAAADSRQQRDARTTTTTTTTTRLSLFGEPLPASTRRRPRDEPNNVQQGPPRPRKIPRARLIQVMEAASLIVQDIHNESAQGIW